MKRNRLLLLHIPKTGGTSIEQTLRNWLGDDEVASHIEGLSTAERGALFEKSFISGHLRYDEARRLPYWPKYKRAVVLREPYARLASALRMTARFGHPGNEAQLGTLPKPARDAAIQLGRLDIEEPCHLKWFLKNAEPWTTEAFANCQTNFLGGAPDALESAIHNLTTFHFIGITESLHDIVAEVATLFDQPPPETVVQVNSATSPEWIEAPPLDHTNAAIREVLAPLLESDVRVYEHVLQLLKRRKTGNWSVPD